MEAHQSSDFPIIRTYVLSSGIDELFTPPNFSIDIYVVK